MTGDKKVDHAPEMTPGELEHKIDTYKRYVHGGERKKRARRFIRRHPEHFTPEEVERAQKKAP